MLNKERIKTKKDAPKKFFKNKERIRIKKDAATRFFKEQNKHFKRGMPQSYRDFGNTLSVLGGRIFTVDRRYGDRVQLKYPPSLVEKLEGGRRVVAIDLEEKYTEPAPKRKRRKK